MTQMAKTLFKLGSTYFF